MGGSPVFRKALIDQEADFQAEVMLEVPAEVFVGRGRHFGGMMLGSDGRKRNGVGI